MEANELRIGNYIKTKQGVEQFTPFMMFGMYNTEVLSVERFDDRYKPIPLTEEWILDFGLKKEKDRSMGFNYTNNSKRFKLVRGNKGYGVKNSNYYKTKYVHQLQNLYFSLTGEELTIK